MKPRIGILGARRRRQGLGPFVARWLRQHGAQVVAFTTTSRSTLREAGDAMPGARGYLELDALLRQEELDALAILTPSEAHREGLEAALEAGPHVLCEKPLVWNGSLDADALIDGFEARGLVLFENCVWPYTLGAYGELHPEALLESPGSFAMRLQPLASGRKMLGDCLPHVLSLLQAVAGEQKVTGVRFTGGGERIAVAFRYGETRVDVELRSSQELPRRAAYALDGSWVQREVTEPGYRLWFRAEDGRTRPLIDPLGLLVADFVRALAAPDAPPNSIRRQEIRHRIRLLADIVRVWDREAR